MSQSVVALPNVLRASPDPRVLVVPVYSEMRAIVDFTFVDANAPACAFYGLDRESLVGERLNYDHKVCDVHVSHSISSRWPYDHREGGRG